MKCTIDGIEMEGTVEEILTVMKAKAITERVVTLEPVKKSDSRVGAWTPARREAFAQTMRETWAKRKKAAKHAYSRNVPVWSEVNKDKILPPPLAEIGSVYKTAWPKDKVLSKLARPHGNDFEKANVEFYELLRTGTIQETKNGRFRAPFGVTRLV